MSRPPPREALAIGDRLELSTAPVDRRQLVQYAGASLDFNRIHYDDAFAREGGQPGVIAHGMLSMGFLGQLLARRFGPDAVRRLKVRFKAVTFPGDVVTCRAEVTALRGAEPDGGPREADLKVWAETSPGRITVEGTATVRLAD